MLFIWFQTVNSNDEMFSWSLDFFPVFSIITVHRTKRSQPFTLRFLDKEEVPFMKKVEIKLSLAENVKTFVNTVNKYDFDMDLRAGRHVVDAKSILGIFSLDLSRPITLEVDDDEHVDPKQLEALLEDIRPFII